MKPEPASPATSLLCSLLLAGASMLATWCTVTLIEATTRSWYASGVGIASPDSRWLPVFIYAAWSTAFVYWVARRGERYT